MCHSSTFFFLFFSFAFMPFIFIAQVVSVYQNYLLERWRLAQLYGEVQAHMASEARALEWWEQQRKLEQANLQRHVSQLSIVEQAPPREQRWAGIHLDQSRPSPAASEPAPASRKRRTSARSDDDTANELSPKRFKRLKQVSPKTGKVEEEDSNDQDDEDDVEDDRMAVSPPVSPPPPESPAASPSPPAPESPAPESPAPESPAPESPAPESPRASPPPPPESPAASPPPPPESPRASPRASPPVEASSAAVLLSEEQFLSLQETPRRSNGARAVLDSDDDEELEIISLVSQPTPSPRPASTTAAPVIVLDSDSDDDAFTSPAAAKSLELTAVKPGPAPPVAEPPAAKPPVAKPPVATRPAAPAGLVLVLHCLLHPPCC